MINKEMKEIFTEIEKGRSIAFQLDEWSALKVAFSREEKVLYCSLASPCKNLYSIIKFEEYILRYLFEECFARDIIGILESNDFSEHKYQVIYDAIIVLFRKSESLNSSNIISELKNSNNLEVGGGADYIEYLQNIRHVTEEITFLAELLKHFKNCKMMKTLSKASSIYKLSWQTVFKPIESIPYISFEK